MATAARVLQSPVRVALADLLRLRAAGEAIRLTAPRVRVAAAGGHLSPYKGRGVEFDESRPYQPGDDLRTIDWRVTARTGKPHTKVFREERNRPVFVWLDLRRPMLFATRGAYKGVRAAEMAALIAWSAVANGDRLGGLVFSETEHHELRPALGLRSALRLFQKIAADSLWQPASSDAPAEVDAEHALLQAHARRAARQPDLPAQRLPPARRGRGAAPAPARGPLRPDARALLRPRRGRASAAGALSNPERHADVRDRDGERGAAAQLSRALCRARRGPEGARAAAGHPLDRVRDARRRAPAAWRNNFASAESTHAGQTVDFTQLPLRDIHLPGLIAWWPPAPGWWIVAALLLAGLVVLGLYYRSGRHRRAALRSVRKVHAALEQGAEPVACLQRVSTTLRRFAMTTADAQVRRFAARRRRRRRARVVRRGRRHDRRPLAPLSRQPLAARRVQPRRGPPAARGAVRAARRRSSASTRSISRRCAPSGSRRRACAARRARARQLRRRAAGSSAPRVHVGAHGGRS